MVIKHLWEWKVRQRMGENISKEYIWIYQYLYAEYEYIKHYNKKNTPVEEWARYFLKWITKEDLRMTSRYMRR